MGSDQTLVQVVRVFARLQLELPLLDCTLVVSRLGKQDRVYHTGNLWVAQWELFLAELASDGCLCVILVSVCIDATWDTNRKFCNLLRCCLSVLHYSLGDHLDVHEDSVFAFSVVSFLMVVTSSWVCTGPQKALHAHVQAVFVFRSKEALCAFVFVDQLSLQMLIDLVFPMWARLSSLSHFVFFR